MRDRFVWAAALLVAPLAPAVAGDNDPRPPTGTGWIVTLGAYGSLEPEFEGSKHLVPSWRPIISYREPESREWLELPNDSFDFAVVETDSFPAGPVVNPKLGFNLSDRDRGYRRFGSLSVSLEAGAFAEFWPFEWLRTRAELRAGAIGASGVVSDLSADVVLRPGQPWTIAIGPRLSLADGQYMQSYYGVGAGQPAAAGLSTYEAHAGLRSMGLGGNIKYKWSERWASLGFVEWQHLAGSAASSPLVDPRGGVDQVTIGAGMSYSFQVDW